MKIFLDFDATLYDTRSYIHDVEETAVGLGVSRDVWRRATAMFRGTVHDPGCLYTVETHIQNAGVDGAIRQELSDAIHAIINESGKYVFPDALEFLERLERERLNILTFGDPAYQYLRVVGAGIEPYVSEIHVTQGDKLEHLLAADIAELVFVDDKASYFHRTDLPEAWHTVHMVRTDECVSPDCRARHHVKSFQEMNMIL